jgi:hypothetical protein
MFNTSSKMENPRAGTYSRRQFLGITTSLAGAALLPPIASGSTRTTVSIDEGRFFISERPTYEGRNFHGLRVEGLLMNSRMANGIFDDLNPATRHFWNYPDTGNWDPERNTRELVAEMSSWRQRGLLSFTLNLQGGNPRGYTKEQPWYNSAFYDDGKPREEYFRRLARVLHAADSLGMAPILGCFYFGQEQRLRDESAVVRALDETVSWVLENGYRNVLLEVNNECNVRYQHAILRPERVHELISRARKPTAKGNRLLVGTSFGGGTIPTENVVAASDFVLLHGNRVEEPARIAEMVKQVRGLSSYRPKPILFNEDDHFHFRQSSNNLIAAMGAYASWGLLDIGENNYRDGYQSPPINWGINTERKQDFFQLVHQVTGA